METPKEKRPQGRPKGEDTKTVNIRIATSTLKKVDVMAEKNGNSRYSELIRIVKNAVGEN